MLYSRDMDKALLHVLFPLLILATALAFVLALSPSASGYAHPAHGGASAPQAHIQANHRTSAPTPTPTAAPGDKSQPGSTDGLVIMSFAIVIIIVLPILIQRALWAR